MGVQIARCLQLRPLISGITWPQPPYLPTKVSASRDNADLGGGYSRLRTNPSYLSCSRDTIRDPLFFRKRLVRIDCRTEATDGHRKDSVKTSVDIERFTFEGCGDANEDVSQLYSFVLREFSVPGKQGSPKVPVLAEGVSMPSSLRKLKKQQGQKRLQEAEDSTGDLTCSIRNAFSSMIFIIRSMQNYTLQMRQILLVESDIRGISAMVHREMQISFVWLFEQVYACTPKLMVSVMILLSNYTAFSVGNIVIPESTSSAELAQTIQGVNIDAVFGTDNARFKFKKFSGNTKKLDSFGQINTTLAGIGSGRISNGKSFQLVAGGSEYAREGYHRKRATYLEEESYAPELHAADQEDALTKTDKAMIKNRVKSRI